MSMSIAISPPPLSRFPFSPPGAGGGAGRLRHVRRVLRADDAQADGKDAVRPSGIK